MAKDKIEIIDAQENNLKHVNVNIPKGQLVVLAGVSGSGKSSLAQELAFRCNNSKLSTLNSQLCSDAIVIVEHRLELIAQADWIIDMGPDGGTSGGEIVFRGPRKRLSFANTESCQ